LPVAAVGVAIEFALLSLGFRRLLGTVAIRASDLLPPKVDSRLLAITSGALVLMFAGFVAGWNLAWTALAAPVVVMVMARRDTHEVLKLVDWHLLLFFAGLFVVVEGLNVSGLPDRIYGQVHGLFGRTTAAQAWNFAWFSAIGSNVFSNVPFVLVAARWIDGFVRPELMWKVMALATTFAGNLTILGSVANVIVVESAREHVEVGFWDYARYGVPVTIATTVAGMAILLWIG
jgi:Na+/H+ antiporter NhaD/arsenite permease-like protein